MKSMYKKLQIITNIEELHNYFIKNIVLSDNNYEYTLINMHNNKQMIVNEDTIKNHFKLTTNDLMQKVQNAHK